MPVHVEYLAGLKIEPFDNSQHDRETFSCGVERIDNFFKITASKYVRDDNGKIYVAVERASARVVGFHAINPHGIDVTDFDAKTRKRFLGGRDRVSAFYLSMLGVDETAQGKGLGTYLLGDVFMRCLAAAEIAGGRFIVLDAITENAAHFYARVGFEALPSHPGRMVISMAKVRKNAEAAIG